METKDPNLLDFGPGAIRKDGYPVGISLYTDGGFGGYYPFAHELGGNMDKQKVVNYFREELKRPDLIVIGANIKYDLEWLRFLGIEVKGRLRDVQLAEPLIDEEAPSYALDALCRKYLGTKKEDTLLREAAKMFGFDPKGDLWRLHSKYVGAYAEFDTSCLLKIHEAQEKELDAQNLWPIYNLECSLIQILLEMRFHGVRVDLDKATLLKMQLEVKEKAMYEKLYKEVGFKLNVNSSDDLAKICRINGWPVPKTLKGNDSFTKDFLNSSTNPFFRQVGAIRNINKLRSMFVEDLIYKHVVNGRIHAEFNQLRDDDGGTRTGRFSSSNPNLQQIPARDKEIAPLIRALFIPEEGEKWCKLDYSQQEPRVLVHYAYLKKFRGADKVRDTYIADKTTDFYKIVAKTANIERKPAKDLSLGICYGEGIDKIARDLHKTVDESKKIKDVFNNANPFVLDMANCAMDKASRTGFIVTLLGRRSRFNLWEPVDSWALKREGVDVTPVSFQQAADKWPGKEYKRAYTYKSLNRLIQGSSADMNKAAMLQNFEINKKVPLSTVHDELNYSTSSREEAEKLQQVMEHAVELTVPIYAEMHYGDHWK